VLQCIDGSRDGEVGLAGACRADAEREVVVLDALEVSGLVRAAWPDPLEPRLDGYVVRRRRVGRDLGAGLTGSFHYGFLQGHVYTFRIDAFLAGHLEQRLDDRSAHARVVGRAGDPEAVAAARDLDVEAALYLAQVLVELAAEVRQAPIVRRFQHDVR